MPIAKEVIGVLGDECQCGRRATVRHCIRCGSTRIYARMDRYHTFRDGSQKYVATQLRCQGCGQLFVEEEREFCDAPPIGPRLAAMKARALAAAKQSGDTLSPREVKLIQAMETVAGPIPLSEEQKQALETQIDGLLRHGWADAVFAHKSHPDKYSNPGTLQDFMTLHREELRKKLAEQK